MSFHSHNPIFIVLPWQHLVYKLGISERYVVVCVAFPYQRMTLPWNNEANKSLPP